MAYERVHTLSDYYDGPREGLANYHGKPHRYLNQWDNTADDWSETYELTPVDAEIFGLEMERWQIWRTWEQAFHAGEVPHESHPGYGGQNARYDELGRIVAWRMLNLKPLDFRLAATFRAVQAHDAKPGVLRELEVEWSLPSNTSLERTRGR